MYRMATRLDKDYGIRPVTVARLAIRARSRRKHASWLNMVEIEIGVLASQCLDRRIETFTRLLAETAAWEKRRNAERARINWMFTTEKARAKMARAYPKPAAASARRQRVKTSVSRY